MGASSFDPSPWLASEGEHGHPAKVANPAKLESPDPSGLAALAALAAAPREGAAPAIVDGVEPLPSRVSMGLHRLAAMPVPKSIRDVSAWHAVVADALRLRDDGWTATALAMGWAPLDLFGLGEWFEGVAVSLRGRTILALLADGGEVGGLQAAFVLDGGDGRRSAINRRSVPDGSKLLWEVR
jgi:hypothetical protein